MAGWTTTQSSTNPYCALSAPVPMAFSPTTPSNMRSGLILNRYGMSDAISVDKVIDLNSSEYYINRELSHLQFNIRVLEQALDETHPLLDRLFFLCIFSKNLDEFYEVRVANLTRQLAFAREQAGDRKSVV